VTVLVTGATGFLGYHVLAALRALGVEAHALVRDPAAWPRGWAAELGDVALVAGSPLDAAAWPLRGGYRAIVHAAAVVAHTRRDPDDMIRVNVEGARNAVRAAARLGARAILISTSGTVGCFAHPDLAADEHAPFAEALVGRWPYYASKIRAERAARDLATRLGVELAIVRPPVLLGPHDHRQRSTGHVARALAGRVPVIPAGGMHFTDVRDAAAAIARLTVLPAARPIYHLPGTASSLAAFFATIAEVSGAEVSGAEVSGADAPACRAPSWLVRGLARLAIPGLPDPVVLEMATRFWGLSTLWSHAELGYAPRGARQTLSDTVAWLRVTPRRPTPGPARAASDARDPRGSARATSA